MILITNVTFFKQYVEVKLKIWPIIQIAHSFLYQRYSENRAGSHQVLCLIVALIVLDGYLSYPVFVVLTFLHLLILFWKTYIGLTLTILYLFTYVSSSPGYSLDHFPNYLSGSQNLRLLRLKSLCGHIRYGYLIKPLQ